MTHASKPATVVTHRASDRSGGGGGIAAIVTALGYIGAVAAGALAHYAYNKYTRASKPTTTKTSGTAATTAVTSTNIDPLDPEWFRVHGHELVDWITDYRARLNSNEATTPDANGKVPMPVQCQLQPGFLTQSLPTTAPSEPDSWQNVMSDVEKLIVPGLTHWQSPHFYAWFKNHASFPSFLGDMLSDAFSSVGFSWLSSPPSAELEAVVMDWMARLIHLPNHFLTSSGIGGGTLCLTAGEAAIIAINTAKQSIVEKLCGGPEALQSLSDARRAEFESKLIVYVSDQAHGVIQRAAKVIGIPSSRIHTIKTSAVNEYRMMAEDVERAIIEDKEKGLTPFFLWLTTGTTSTAAIDDPVSLCSVGHQHGLHVHADAAYGGVFALLPELRPLFDFSQCDSLNINAHKGLFTHFDAAFLWVNDRRHLINSLALIQMPYLKNKFTDSGAVIDYKDWGLSFGRRFRSLKVWCVMRIFGVSRLRDMLRFSIKACETMGQLFVNDGNFELMTVQRLGLLCFRAHPPAIDDREKLNELNKLLMDRCNASGQLFFSQTNLNGVIVLRLATSGAETEAHIIRDANIIIEVLKQILSEQEHSAGLPTSESSRLSATSATKIVS